MLVNRLAWIALISVLVLVLAGATVRVTGAGLGCPDWPTCWGCLIPPTSVDQIDVEKLDLEKFKRQARRRGIDPDTITRETVLESFDPVHTWIEFGNRLTSMPLGSSTLLLAIASFWAKKNKWWIVALAWFALFDVLFNAYMGAVVVASGLQPGIITLHMALAFLLISVLVTIVWLSRREPDVHHLPKIQRRRLLIVSIVFFACLFGEGLIGSQLREQTDELGKNIEGIPRSEWIEQIDSTMIFKIHRSFSWSLLITAGLMMYWSFTSQQKFLEPKIILALVVAMMIMGIVLGHIAIFEVVQVLHVGTTAVLLAVTWHWIMRVCFTPTLTRESS